MWFGVPCASLSCLVQLKSSALLASQFSRLFAVNYVSKADGFCFFNWAIMLGFFSGRFCTKVALKQRSLCPYFLLQTLLLQLTFTQLVIPPGTATPVWGATCLGAHKKCIAFRRLQQELLLLKSWKAFFWWYFCFRWRALSQNHSWCICIKSRDLRATMLMILVLLQSVWL